MSTNQRKKRTCPHCGADIVWEGNPCRPFCSERCRLLDLGNWASGRYCIPGERVSDEEVVGEGSSHDEEST